MSTEINQEYLARMIDRQKIWECLLRYTRGVDRMDLELIRSAFWEDATNSHGPVCGTAEDFIKAWYPAQALRDLSFHMVSNQAIEFDGDRAHCEAYFMAAIRVKGRDTVEMVGGRYIDTFEKRGNDWRIKTRLLLLDWQGLLDGTEMQKRMMSRHTGSRDRNDPSYERPVQPRNPIATPWQV